MMSSPMSEMSSIWTLIVKCVDVPGMMKHGIRVPNDEDGLYGTDGGPSALHFIPTEVKLGVYCDQISMRWEQLDPQYAAIMVFADRVLNAYEGDEPVYITNGGVVLCNAIINW